MGNAQAQAVAATAAVSQTRASAIGATADPRAPVLRPHALASALVTATVTAMAVCAMLAMRAMIVGVLCLISAHSRAAATANAPRVSASATLASKGSGVIKSIFATMVVHSCARAEARVLAALAVAGRASLEWRASTLHRPRALLTARDMAGVKHSQPQAPSASARRAGLATHVVSSTGSVRDARSTAPATASASTAPASAMTATSARPARCCSACLAACTAAPDSVSAALVC